MMHRYTIAKTLALFLGVFSVAARSLPERRSEINVRSPGGKQLVGQYFDALSLTTLALLFFPHYRHNHTPLVSDVGDSEELGTATYSVSNNTTFPKRDDGDFFNVCTAVCSTNAKHPDQDDFEFLYNYIAEALDVGTFP